MGFVHETVLNDTGDAADLLDVDGRPFADGEAVRVHWPDGSTSEELAAVVPVEMGALTDGTQARTRTLLLLRCTLRGLRVTVRPALDKLRVDRVALGPALQRPTCGQHLALLRAARHKLGHWYPVQSQRGMARRMADAGWGSFRELDPCAFIINEVGREVVAAEDRRKASR